MALSNWDTLAFNESGEPCSGHMEGFKEGASVEIYKNWLYVRDTKMWCEGRGYTEPTIAEISQGDIHLSDFEIRAVRGPQQAIFCYVKSTDYTPEVSKVRRMAGIGCNGWEDNTQKMLDILGLGKEEDYEFVMEGSSYGPEGSFATISTTTKGGTTVTHKLPGPREDYDPKFVGVLPATFKAFIEWLKDVEYGTRHKEWAQKIEGSDKVRFNQGDAFFSAALGIPLVSSEPGKAEEPILTQALKEERKD